MTIRSLRTASMLLCVLPLIWTACGGSDAPEGTPKTTPEITPQPGGSADAARSGGAPAPAPTPTPETAFRAAPAFTDTEWRLVALEPNDGDAITPNTVAGAVPSLQFNAKPSPDGMLRVVGFGGCNKFIGDYTAGDDGSLSLPAPLVMTQAACADPIQKLETALMKSLAGASDYSLEDDELTIRSEEGSLRFSGG
jgi:heat shock protein HslJ